jgi:hypothetical protein
MTRISDSGTAMRILLIVSFAELSARMYLFSASVQARMISKCR